MINFLVKSLGLSWLIKQAYGAVRPELLKWAQADNEVDWDDKIVEILDHIIEAIAGKLKEEGK